MHGQKNIKLSNSKYNGPYSSSASKELTCIVWSPKIHYHGYSNPSADPILS